jgi:hypothetical protein
MAGFVDEFKKFAMKGNVVDLAVGVIIGGAFGKIVASLVEDVGQCRRSACSFRASTGGDVEIAA